MSESELNCRPEPKRSEAHHTELAALLKNNDEARQDEFIRISPTSLPETVFNASEQHATATVEGPVRDLASSNFDVTNYSVTRGEGRAAVIPRFNLAPPFSGAISSV